MRSLGNMGRKVAAGAPRTWDHQPDCHRQLGVLASTWPALGVALAIFVFSMVAKPSVVHSQDVKLVTVDVNVVAQGSRISRLTGSSVVNEKNQKIDTIDDFVVPRNRTLFAVLQVGGFLGMGARLVAVPYDSLVDDDEGRNVQFPGASKEELKKLPEIKYRS